MDEELRRLRAQFERDPQNREDRRALARALDRAGRSFEAYVLLWEDGAIKRRDREAIALGRRLAEGPCARSKT